MIDSRINNDIDEDIIKMTCEIDIVRFYRDGWGILVVTPHNITEGEVITDYNNRAVIKGEMPEPKVGDMIKVKAYHVEDRKWGDQYNLISSYPAYNLNDDISKRKFLESLFTVRQVETMYDAYPDPFDLLEKGDVGSLVQIKGCGIKTATNWIDRFNSKKDLIVIFTELSEFNLTNRMVERLMERYKNPLLVVEKVKDNPYVLCNDINGIGWNRADEVALSSGIEKYGEIRVSAYILYYLRVRAENGCSWITNDELLGAILDTLGEEIPDENITNALNYIKERLWIDSKTERIGLKRYRIIEEKIAKELIRIRDAESEVLSPSDWKETIKRLESRQGWDYTDEQKMGIKSTLDNNVVVIHGLAGVGKSTVVSAMIAVLKRYSFVQCALSGRAASRLSEITGQEGYTIHRLLRYPVGTPDKGLFYYHDERQLPYEIYILDEISMVDGQLFYNLLRAIPSGSKIICLGDIGQLESIGTCNVAYDMIHSGEIPVVELTQIHRQAKKSAIVTDSIAIRHGQQIIDKGWAGDVVRGELKDVKYSCFSDASNTYHKVVEAFKKELEKPDFNIMNVQVLSPRRKGNQASCYDLNNALQELYNPAKNGKREEVLKGINGSYILREGDKVMNINNNYKTSPPIYNGNIGILRQYKWIEDKEYMIIDFLGIGTVYVEKKYWGSIELGYAITVHKFQGSECKRVIFALDFGSYALLTRELLYTGITRAKEYCHVIAQTGAFRYAVAQEGVTQKQTHLIECLHEVAHPVLSF